MEKYLSSQTKELKSFIKQNTLKTILLTIPITTIFFLMGIISTILYNISKDPDIVSNSVLLAEICTVIFPICLLFTIIMFIINHKKIKDSKKLLKISLQNDMKHFEEKLKTK